MSKKISRITNNTSTLLNTDTKNNTDNNRVKIVEQDKLVKKIPQVDLSNRFNELQHANRSVKVNKGKSYFNSNKDTIPQKINILEYSAVEQPFNANGEITTIGKTIYISIFAFIEKILVKLGIIDEGTFLCRHLALAVMQNLITIEDLDKVKTKEDFTQLLEKCSSVKKIAFKNINLLGQLDYEYSAFFKVNKKQDITNLFVPKSLKDIYSEIKKNQFDEFSSNSIAQMELIKNTPSLLLLPENNKILKEITEKNSNQVKNLKIFSTRLLTLGFKKDYEQLESLLEKEYFTQKDRQLIKKITQKDKYYAIIRETYKQVKADIQVADGVYSDSESSTVIFSEHSFANSLHYMCESVINSPDTNEENFILQTSNHAMTFSIKCADNQISIMFYDPSDTNTYKMVELSSIQYVKQLNINDFITARRRSSYGINELAQITMTASKENNLMFIRSKKN